MRIHSLQHVAFEDVGSMLHDIRQHQYELTTTHWYKGDQAPAMDNFDLLIIMGGPMGIYDEAEHPWLADEKIFIARAIAAGKKIIGICLGAQLLADVLGANVTRNAHREIGWFPLTINPTAQTHPVAKILAQSNEVFHWHGDTFAIPQNAQLIASSAACAHQAYIVNEQIFAFQFHLETTTASATALIQHCPNDLDNSTYVQSAEKMLGNPEKFLTINNIMSQVFQYILTV